VASRMAVAEFTRSVKEAGGPGDWPVALRRAAEAANAAVYEASLSKAAYDGMGTTLVAALAAPEEIVVINVGDSRCYQILNGEISQVTRDHSLVEDLLDRGDITREQARVHPQRNLITRALGVEDRVRPDLFWLPNRGGYLLLCSDGLSNMLTDEQLRREVVAEDKDTCCSRLLRQALDRGATDNVTAIVVQL